MAGDVVARLFAPQRGRPATAVCIGRLRERGDLRGKEERLDLCDGNEIALANDLNLNWKSQFLPSLVSGINASRQVKS